MQKKIIFVYCTVLMSLMFSQRTLANDYQTSCIDSFKINNIKTTRIICEQQLNKALEDKAAKSVLAIYIALADIYSHSGDYELFDQFMLKAESHPLFKQELNNQYDWLRLKAMRLHHKKNYTESSQIFQKALEVALKLNDEKKIENSNLDLGISAKTRGDYKTALNYHRTALDLSRQSKDPYAIGFALNSLGKVYVNLEEYELAIKYFNEAIEMYEQYIKKDSYDHRVHNSISKVYEKLIEVYQILGEKEKAQQFKIKIQQSQSRLPKGHEYANDLVHQAKNLLEQEKYIPSHVKLSEALDLYQQEGIENPSEVYYLLAKAYQGLALIDLAIEYALKAVKSTQNETLNDPTSSQTYLLLSQLYKNTDLNKALFYANQYNQSRESFLEKKYNSDLKTIQHQIELEKNQNKLVNSQLKVAYQDVKIQTLRNRFLLTILLLLTVVALVIYVFIKKKQQQRELLASIDYHKNQLAVLSLSSQPKKSLPNKVSQPKIDQNAVNKMLVQMMHDAINVWTELTGKGLIDLADNSKIWTITNDNGTLRTRSLEKYLSIQKIPQNPRWRNVVRTCHFVLAEPGLSASKRQFLNEQLKSLIQVIKDYYGTD